MEIKIFLLALTIRLVIIVWGEYQHSLTGIDYSDIDYKVYTDGAKYVMQGGSPFERHTYRYTPLLSYLMIPNLYFESFGKVLFSLSDIACSLVIEKILREQG